MPYRRIAIDGPKPLPRTALPAKPSGTVRPEADQNDVSNPWSDGCVLFLLSLSL